MVAAQRDVLSAYLALYELRSDWSRALILIENLDRETAATAMAAVIAGAGALGLTDEAATARELMRLGCCDYVVTSLNEALRILKNSLRQGKAVGVALVCAKQATLQEMSERGVLAQFSVSSPIVSPLPLISKTCVDFAERRAMDAALSMQADDRTKRWLQAAPLFFSRDLTRWVPERPSHP